ncbi:MAG TPA: hypothetical protein PKZ43_07695 [Bacteroidales bacterium]|nr:hypothetical protein [Bacteroidales bacterium]HQI46789.1 hypothetical protein [Bacteroidales bacterium]
MISKILSFLSKQTFSLLIIAVLMQTYVVHISSRMGSDDMFQIASTKNFINGHGFTIPRVNTDNCKVEYNRLEDWPLGYSLTIAPLLYITNNNFELSELIIHFLALFLLFFATLKILLLIIPPEKKWSISLLFIFFTFAYVPFRHTNNADLLCLGIYLSIIYFIIKFYQNSHNLFKEFLFIFGISLLSASLSFIRYAFYPHTLSIFCFFILAAFCFHKKLNIKLLAYSFFILLFSALFIYIQIRSQTYTASLATNYLSGSESFSNSGIKIFYAPFFNAFFPDNIFYSIYFQISGNNTIPIVLFGIISFVSFILLFFLLKIILPSFSPIFSFYFTKNRNTIVSSSQAKLHFLYLTALFTILCNIFFLFIIYKGSVLSWAELLGKNSLYTYYAVISRYISITYFFTILTFFIYIVLHKNNFLKKTLFILFFCSFIFQFSHWLYLRSKFSLTDRQKNMSEMNLPYGSYNDFILLHKKISTEKERIIYIVTEDEKTNYYRQLRSEFFVSANGGITMEPQNFIHFKCDDLINDYKILVAKHKIYDNIYINQILSNNKHIHYICLKNSNIDIYQIIPENSAPK